MSKPANPFREIIKELPKKPYREKRNTTLNWRKPANELPPAPENPLWKQELDAKNALAKDKRRAILPLTGNEVIDWWRQEPVDFIKDILGVNLWSLQKAIVESVRDNARTSVRSCSSAGKTALSACIVLWFLCAFKPSTVLVTGKSYRQIKEQLWREIRTRHAGALRPIGGNITQVGLDLAEDWFALGFSTDEPDRITGFHNQHVLVIMDEASGVSDEVYGAIDNPLSSGWTRLLLLGNPTQSVGKFRDSFASPTYNSFPISAFDTPNFTGEGDGAFSFLISKNYIEEKKEEWGEDNPLYEVYILGNFPSGETDRLIPFGYGEQAVNREIKPHKEEAWAIGLDTARFGDDETVLYTRHGDKVVNSVFMRKKDTEAIIGMVVHEINRLYKEHDAIPAINVDEGYNPGVVDGLRALRHKVTGVSFQSTARQYKLYANVKAEMFWDLAQKFKEGTIDIPNDKVLLKQVTDIKKKPLDRTDRIIIESKDEMKTRGLKSPDRADALALCFMNPVPRCLSIRWI